MALNTKIQIQIQILIPIISRNMTFMCSSSLVFFVVLFWFVCLRPMSCVTNVYVCVWIVHSWLPLRYVISFTIITQRYQPPYIENQCRLKIITNNKGNNKITEHRAIFQRERQNSQVNKQTKSVNNRKTAISYLWPFHLQ